MSEVWTWIADRKRWFEAIIILLILQLLTLVIPQAPTVPKDSPAFTRWLAGVRPTFGDSTGNWAALGLFTLRTSLFQRIVRGYLALLGAVQMARLWEHHKTFAARRHRQILALCLGAVLMLSGWVTQLRLGWTETGLTTWPGELITVNGYQIEPPQSQHTLPAWSRHYGLYLVPEGKRTGLRIHAADTAGNSLPLLSSVKDASRETLQAVLDDPTPEVFFAAPDVGMIFRVSQRKGQIQVQAYRSASGDLVAEVPLQPEERLTIGEVTLDIQTQSIPRYRAVYNPGAAIEGIGILLIAAGVIIPQEIESELTGEASASDEATDSEGASNAVEDSDDQA